MKIILIGVFVILNCNIQLSAHPLHVAIVNIDVKDLELKITIRTFIDDWETAYFHYYGDTINLKFHKNYNSDWFNSYLERSLKINIPNKETSLQLVRDTLYFSDLSMILEMHASLKEKPKSLYIYNSILTDIFADQTNLVIFSAGGKEKGIKFDFKKKSEEVKLR